MQVSKTTDTSETAVPAESDGYRNGIDVDLLFDTMRLVRAQPELGKLRFRARNRWVGGQHNRSVLKDFYALGREDASRREPFILDAGQPPLFAGANEGPDPAECLLHALAASLTTTLVYVAAALGVELTDVQSTVEGELDLRGALGLSPDVPNGYESIRVTFRVQTDAPTDTIRDLLEQAKQRSVVYDTLSRGVPITVELAG